MGDLKSFHVRYIALRQAIIADGIRHGVPFHLNDLRYLSERIVSEGTSFVLVTLPQLGKALDLGLVSGTLKVPAHFKKRKNTELPSFLYSPFREVFDDTGVLLHEKADIQSIRFLRLFLLFDGKLEIQHTPQQEKEAVDSFVDRMSALRNQRVDVRDPILRRARLLLGKVLCDLDLSEILPKHGPGSVAESLDRDERWDFRSWPLRAEKEYPFSRYGTHSLYRLMELGRQIRYTRKSVTRCCLVPKDFKGPRLISAETTVNQYLQQGQMRLIMKYIDRHPILRHSIRLQDQTFNQRRARESLSENQATVDLSNASDTISVPLFWYLFGEVPKLRRQLMSTRSDFMSYKGREIRIASFAPMGSATCFPVETLIFWAISMAALGETEYRNNCDDVRCPTYYKLVRRACQISCFGDDLIVPNSSLTLVFAIFHKVGFKVNVSKTCFNTPFRESCGSEWYMKTDVSIIRNRQYMYTPSSLGNYPVILQLQRKFFLRGMLETAALLTMWAQESYPVLTISIRHTIDNDASYYPRLIHSQVRGSYSLQKWLLDLDYFERESLKIDKWCCALGACSDYPSELHYRYNASYQRIECRVPCLIQKTRTWNCEGYPRLLARLLHDSTDRVVTRGLRPKMTWSSLP